MCTIPFWPSTSSVNWSKVISCQFFFIWFRCFLLEHHSSLKMTLMFWWFFYVWNRFQKEIECNVIGNFLLDLLVCREADFFWCPVIWISSEYARSPSSCCWGEICVIRCPCSNQQHLERLTDRSVTSGDGKVINPGWVQSSIIPKTQICLGLTYYWDYNLGYSLVFCLRGSFHHHHPGVLILMSMASPAPSGHMERKFDSQAKLMLQLQ